MLWEGELRFKPRGDGRNYHRLLVRVWYQQGTISALWDHSHLTQERNSTTLRHMGFRPRILLSWLRTRSKRSGHSQRDWIWYDVRRWS
jgi:hypothetical protein